MKENTRHGAMLVPPDDPPHHSEFFDTNDVAHAVDENIAHSDEADQENYAEQPDELDQCSLNVQLMWKLLMHVADELT